MGLRNDESVCITTENYRMTKRQAVDFVSSKVYEETSYISSKFDLLVKRNWVDPIEIKKTRQNEFRILSLEDIQAIIA